MIDQKSENFESLDRSEIPEFMRGDLAAMERSSADEVWTGSGMKYMIVHAIGRKSGEVRKVVLPYWLDEYERPIVVASYAGNATHPAWFLNLTAKNAEPEVFCRFQKENFWATVDVLEGKEYAKYWELLTVDRPFYRDYQAICERRIPLLRFLKTRVA